MASSFSSKEPRFGDPEVKLKNGGIKIMGFIGHIHLFYGGFMEVLWRFYGGFMEVLYGFIWFYGNIMGIYGDTWPGKQTKSELENGPVEIVDLPIKHGLWFVVDLPLWVIYC